MVHFNWQYVQYPELTQRYPLKIEYDKYSENANNLVKLFPYFIPRHRTASDIFGPSIATFGQLVDDLYFDFRNGYLSLI